MLKIAKDVSLFVLTLPSPSFFSPHRSPTLFFPPLLSLSFSPLLPSPPFFFFSLSSFLLSPLFPLFSSLFRPCKSKLHLPVEDHLASAGQKGILQEMLHFLHVHHLPNKVDFLFFTCSLHVIIFSKPFLYLAEPVQPFLFFVFFLPSCFWYSACYSDFLSKFLAHNPWYFTWVPEP